MSKAKFKYDDKSLYTCSDENEKTGSVSKIVVLGSMAESLVNFRGEMIRTMIARNHTVYACAPDASRKTRAELLSIGAVYVNIPLVRTGMNPLHDLRFIVFLFSFFKKVKPDLLFSYTLKPVLYGSLIARVTGVQAIFSMITGLGFFFIGSGIKKHIFGLFIRGLYRLSLKVNKNVFFQNNDDRDLFFDLNLLKDRSKAVRTNGSGVDVSCFRLVPFPVVITFLMIARLIRDKGIFEYLKAARVIKLEFPRVQFDLVGYIDDNPASISQKELNDLKKEAVINYKGKLEDVRPAIEASSIYVLPSYREGTPRTVLEAMSMGRPIITTDVPGCRETVEDGLNGFLVKDRDAEALANAMRRFIDKPDLISEFGKASRKVAEKKFDVKKVNETILHTMGLN
jgi:glycosyltransferase involved in cell wall biosynthesis